MPVNVPHSKPPPKPARRVSPAKWAWLDRINRQLAFAKEILTLITG